MNKLEIFSKLSILFKENGYPLYLVGGSVRDYLLSIELDDMDVVTSATPNEMKKFIDGDYTFAHLGCVKYIFGGVKFDITTLRKERSYVDSRHPNSIKFVKSLRSDYKRRDFTINAMYMATSLKIIDYVGGQKDIKNKILKMVGEPNKRLIEDPLRILRAFRFASTYNLTLDNKLEAAIKNHIDLLNKLNKQKIIQEIKKVPLDAKPKFLDYLNNFSIKYLIDMIDY